MLYEYYLPYCLVLGVPYETFWSSGFNKKSIESYEIAFKDKRKILDEEMWYMGMYVNNAVTVAVEHCLAGKKAKSKYLEKPILKDVKMEKEKPLTEKEKIQKTENLFKMLERMGKNIQNSKSGKAD